VSGPLISLGYGRLSRRAIAGPDEWSPPARVQNPAYRLTPAPSAFQAPRLQEVTHSPKTPTPPVQGQRWLRFRASR